MPQHTPSATIQPTTSHKEHRAITPPKSPQSMSSQSEMPTALVQRIHDSDTMAVFSVAGAGTAAISWLLGVAGASRTVLEILVPYASTSLTEFVGSEPSQFVSEDTAILMAKAAYRRALQLREGANPVVGIACTATIATDRTKRGNHRCHVAAWSGSDRRTYNLTYIKGLRDRAGEDDIASKLVMRAIAESANVVFDADLGLSPSESVQTSALSYVDAIEALMARHLEKAIAHPDGSMFADGRFSGGILSGSFNPLHEGHRALADAASRILGQPVAYELSVANVDKPPLPEHEVRRRISQFAGSTVVLTQAARFFQKTRLLPDCAFIIGGDTAVRLVDPRYYEGNASHMIAALQEMRQNGCRFLVAGRADGEKFITLSDVSVPDGFGDMFTAIPESAFRRDISSTQIRQAQGVMSV